MVKTDQKENFDLVIFDHQPLLQVHPKLSKKLQYSVGDFEVLFFHISTRILFSNQKLGIPIWDPDSTRLIEQNKMNLPMQSVPVLQFSLLSKEFVEIFARL